MKIAISDAARNWRGSEAVTATLANGFRKCGHDVLIFCRRDSLLREKLATEFLCVPALGGSDINPVTLARIYRTLGRHRPDIVITQKDKDLRLTGLVARSRHIPVLVRHITDRPLKSRLRYRFYFGGTGLYHVANSVATRNTLFASAPWFKGRVDVIPNGIDAERYENAEPIELPMPADALVVGFVGQFEFRKGILDFARAWHRVADAVPQAHAVIAGAGARQPELEQALVGAPRVHWAGFQKDVAPLMRALDILVMPSRFEGFGLVMAEAMAAGAAVVGYDASSLPELAVNGREAILVRPGDVEALATAVIHLAQNAGRRAELGRAAQLRAREFSEDKMVARYLELATAIVARKRA